MNVKRAFQLFGRRFAAAVEVAGNDPKGLKGRSATWEKTAAFIKRIDKLIDYCNCYNTNSNYKKRPLREQHDIVYNTLQEMMEWTKKWSVSPYKHESPMMKRPPCFKGLTQTLRAFLHVFDTITDEEDTRHFQFALGLANQDSVEHLFSKLRQRGGFNMNPTSRVVRLNLRHIMCSQLFPVQCNLTGEHSAADEEDDGALECATHLCENTEDNAEAATSNKDNDGLSFYEATSITYFAGYIVHHIMRKYNCTECRDQMMKTPLDTMEPEEAYIANREFSPDVTKLSRPTDTYNNPYYTAQMQKRCILIMLEICKNENNN